MKEKFKSTLKEEWIYYLIILAGTIAFWFPYLAKGFFPTGENDFHFARIQTLADAIEVGVFPAKVRPSHMRYFGYGIGFFYPDLFIYPPAILIAIGADYEITVKAYLFIMYFLGGVLVYKCFKKLSGNAKASLIGELLYMGSGLNDRNVFDGGGMPHFFSYLFLPLAFCGFLEALNDEKKGYIKYAVGITLVLLTHNMIFITLMFLLLIILLINIKSVVSNIRVIGKLAAVSLAAMLIATAYWLPAMEQVSRVEFKCFYANAYDITNYILTFKEMVFDNIEILYFGLFVVSAAIYIVMLIRRRKMPMDITSVFITTVITLWLMCSRLLWTSPIGKALNFFEYTSRFEFVAVALIVIFAVMVAREALLNGAVNSFIKRVNKKYAYVLFCIAVILVTRFLARPDFYDLNKGDRIVFSHEMLEEKWLVSLAEWLPVECEPSECKESQNARADDHTGADGFKHENGKYFEVWLDMSKQYYDMPYVYYYGYKAYILDDNNNPVRELEVQEAFDDNGLVRVMMPGDNNEIGHVMVTYRKTPIQKISYNI